VNSLERAREIVYGLPRWTDDATLVERIAKVLDERVVLSIPSDQEIMDSGYVDEMDEPFVDGAKWAIERMRGTP